MTTPPIKVNRGIYVRMTVGDVFFTTERSFRKWWNAQSETVKQNLNLPEHRQTVDASTTASTSTGNDQD